MLASIVRGEQIILTPTKLQIYIIINVIPLMDPPLGVESRNSNGDVMVVISSDSNTI
jgi:hypothetical protein